MRCTFLSDEWFAAVDALIANAGDLDIPPAMKAAEINVTVATAAGDRHVYVHDGILSPGHRPTAPTSITLDEALARRIFVDADTVAGVQAFLAGEIKVDGDLAKLVAMQMEEPSAKQKALAIQIAAITC
jgi:hypothetical protein